MLRALKSKTTEAEAHALCCVLKQIDAAFISFPVLGDLIYMDFTQTGIDGA